MNFKLFKDQMSYVDIGRIGEVFFKSGHEYRDLIIDIMIRTVDTRTHYLCSAEVKDECRRALTLEWDILESRMPLTYRLGESDPHFHLKLCEMCEIDNLYLIDQLVEISDYGELLEVYIMFSSQVSNVTLRRELGRLIVDLRNCTFVRRYGYVH